MVKITLNLLPKQYLAMKYLKDKETRQLYYGGAAGGGKSVLICMWLIESCLIYPGSRWLLGRAYLTRLKDSTLMTFFDLCNKWGLKRDIHYKFNQISNKIEWFNGSIIFLRDLFQYPSDPHFDSLGSTEFTGAAIDEASEVTEKAKNIVLSRLRYRLNDYGVIPKLLIASNPAKNWLYTEFYKPYKEGTLTKDKKFIPALVTDNPHLPLEYIESLKLLDEVSKQRLLYGNFEYDDDILNLFKYNQILDLFTNPVTPDKERKYITSDIARFGRDKTVITYWEGLVCKDIKIYEKQDVVEVANLIDNIRKEYGVRMSNVIVDEDGVGGGVKDILKCRGFVNNSRPIGKDNFTNLKSQCYFKLSELSKQGKVLIQARNELKNIIIEELEVIKMKDIDKDRKLAIESKDKIKEVLGKSPDIADALMMRFYFELESNELIISTVDYW